MSTYNSIYTRCPATPSRQISHLARQNQPVIPLHIPDFHRKTQQQAAKPQRRFQLNPNRFEPLPDAGFSMLISGTSCPASTALRFFRRFLSGRLAADAKFLHPAVQDRDDQHGEKLNRHAAQGRQRHRDHDVRAAAGRGNHRNEGQESRCAGH